MNILELKDKRSLTFEVMESLVNSGRTESRKLDTDESNRLSEYMTQIEELNKKIDEAEEANKREENKTKMTKMSVKKDRTMERKFSIGEMIQRNLKANNHNFEVPVSEYRAVGQEATTDAGGGYTVETEIWNLVRPLENALVTVQAGAQIHTGLQGDIAVDTMTSPSLGWTTETGSASQTSTTFSQATFTPHRLTATLDISNQLINQSVFAVDQIIEQEMVRQVALKLEGALFSEANVSNAANSIMASLTDISGSLTWANMIEFETLLASANNLFGSVKYITNSAGVGKLKQTVRVSSTDSQVILENGMVNGYPVLSTNSIPSTFGASNNEAGVILADWSDLHLYNFGNVDVIMDPYTQAAAGKIRLVLNSYWDAGFHRSTSRKVGSFGL